MDYYFNILLKLNEPDKINSKSGKYDYFIYFRMTPLLKFQNK